MPAGPGFTDGAAEVKRFALGCLLAFSASALAQYTPPLTFTWNAIPAPAGVSGCAGGIFYQVYKGSTITGPWALETSTRNTSWVYNSVSPAWFLIIAKCAASPYPYVASGILQWPAPYPGGP